MKFETKLFLISSRVSGGGHKICLVIIVCVHRLNGIIHGALCTTKLRYAPSMCDVPRGAQGRAFCFISGAPRVQFQLTPFLSLQIAGGRVNAQVFSLNLLFASVMELKDN